MRTLWHAIAYLNLGLLAADHFVTSVAAIFFPQRAAALYRRMFGVQLPLTPETAVMMKPWGALGIFAALAGALPILDVQRYRGVLYALLVLLALRVYIRLAYARDGRAHVGIAPARNVVHVYLIVQTAAIIAAQLIWW